jgi:hypothetical protein
MSEINDQEFLPDPESLSPFGHGADTRIHPLGRDFWEKLDLSDAKAAELTARLRQREAVTRLIKDDLELKLQTFGIPYFVAFTLVIGAIASVSKLSYYPRLSDKLTIIVASNGLYYSFIMMLGLFYPLARKVKWPFPVAAFLFIILWPFIQDRVLALVSPTAVLLLAATVIIPISIILINGTRSGREAWSRLTKLRRDNMQENSNREQFVKRVEEMFPTQGSKFRALLRGVFLRSASRVSFSILTSDEYADRKGALLEFAKRQKFKDSMGRLTGAIWIACSLIYLILPQIPEVEMISSAAVAVLPVYYFAMLIMSVIDEEREEVLTDVAELIKSEKAIQSKNQTQKI